MQPSGEGIKITTEAVRSRSDKGKMLNQYVKIKRIGEGNYSKIKLMRDSKTSIFYAAKKYNMFILKKKTKMSRGPDGKTIYSTAADEVHQEIAVLKHLRHLRVTNLHEIIEVKEEQKLYLLMDYCKGGDLAVWNSRFQQFICKWPIPTLVRYLWQAVEGIAYLHSRDVIHRDIKPQNILVCEQGDVKVADFSRSVILPQPNALLKGSQGTYHFMAPEVLEEKDPAGFDGKRADMWAFGVSIYGILFKDLPFNSEFLPDLFQLIELRKFTYPSDISDEKKLFVPLIDRLLSLDPKERPTAEQTIQILKQIQTKLTP